MQPTRLQPRTSAEEAALRGVAPSGGELPAAQA